MLKNCLLPLVISTIFISVSHAQGFAQLGTQFIEDQGNRMIATSDGGYITAGIAGSKAILYRTDCLGNLVAQLEKAFIPGPATFSDVVELADGSIVAVGWAFVTTPTDTGSQVLILKTNPMLEEIAFSTFPIQNNQAQGKSITKTPTGQLLIFGEVVGDAVDFTDLFFQRVDPITLQPTAAPVVGSNGIDLASQILPTADGNYLLSGSSFIGNVFNPDEPIQNFLRAYKVDEFGSLIWQASIPQTFLAKYGVAQSCGAVQSSVSGNFVLGGTLFGGTDAKKQDIVFILISNDGVVLDTAYSDAPENQRAHAIAENHAYPGAYALLGDGDGSPFGIPTLLYTQAYETANQIFSAPAQIDYTNPVSLRDLAEIDAGRFAFMGTVPDNPTTLSATDIIISTPEATIGVVFQNCALAATLSVQATVFQWLYEGEVIPNANQGVYFPTKPGLYQVQVLDSKGCYGVSDTFRVKAPVAAFSFISSNLTTDFTNNSSDAASYNWDFGDGGTSSQANPTHSYASNGTYTVRLIARTACGFADTLFQQIGIVSALEPSWLEQFSLTPNPTNDRFSVEMNGTPQASVSFQVTNAVGQLVQHETSGFQTGWLQKSFDLEGFPAGIYTLQIRSGNESKNVRIVKQ